MTEPQSSLPVMHTPTASVQGRTYLPLDDVASTQRHGLRDLLLGLGVLALILSVLAILGRVAEPLNFALAGVVVAIVGVVWLLRRAGR